jgi:large subunit ribosomal protein L21e
MTKRIGSARRKTRRKMSRSVAEKSRINITAYMQEFKIGEHVVLKADPSYQKGNYHGRFHGKPAIVEGMQGECCVVVMKAGSKEKRLIVHPVHLIKE